MTDIQDYETQLKAVKAERDRYRTTLELIRVGPSGLTMLWIAQDKDIKLFMQWIIQEIDKVLPRDESNT